MRSAETRILSRAQRILNEAGPRLFAGQHSADSKLSLLEVVASIHAGWSVEEFWKVTRGKTESPAEDPYPTAKDLLAEIEATSIPTPLALAALAREEIPTSAQKKTGAYYTDWRLAQMLAAASVAQVDRDGPWIDPACGSGILLVAAVLATPESEHESLVRDRLCGADLSSRALRGTLLAVASLSKRLATIEQFQGRLVCGDSLRSRDVWSRLAPAGFALVIGNPPWERLRTSRHELASTRGEVRHYGQRFKKEVDLSESRSEILDYLDQVVSGTRLQGKGEHDLYKLFLELGLGLAAEGGIVAQLVPAGLIRSQGTESLRRELDELARELHVFVLENRQQHFSIDSRFKFLAVLARVGAGRRQPIMLKVADRSGFLPSAAIPIVRKELRQVRPDLTIPEVRSTDEWDLYSRLSRSGVRIGDPNGPWRPKYQRELDMTNDRRSFERHHRKGVVAVLEGRHVAQYRSRAKSFQSGEGRAAIWRPEPLPQAKLGAQWFVDPGRLRSRTQESVVRSRVGFCDITGQTNERSLLVSRIPAGVVCGNKVPTLVFSEGDAEREDLFIALANSFVVDWMLRRILTTTVNFFLLDSLPLPVISEKSAEGSRLIELSRLVTSAEGSKDADSWKVAAWRAEIDSTVAMLWGVSFEDMRLILDDFPLLDRGQPALPEESASTVTADLVLSTLASAVDMKISEESTRLQKAKALGATPYVPAEYV